MNLIQDDYSRFARLGFIAGIKRHKKFVPRVKPLRNITERQTTTYFYSRGFDTSPIECPYRHTALRQVVRKALNDLEFTCPGSKSAILEWFDKIRPGVHTESAEIITCERCGEPSSKRICEACVLKVKL
jgi:uncharacterized protein (TIGR00269 family)